MLYYIIPPIIIVVSLAALIYFVFRRVNGLAVPETRKDDRVSDVSGRFKKAGFSVGQAGLRMLEKVVQRLKLALLRMHNASNQLFHAVKNRRESVEKFEDIHEQAIGRNSDRDAFVSGSYPEEETEKSEPIEVSDKEEVPVIRRRRTHRGTQPVSVPEVARKASVRKSPEAVMPSKDQLEKVLIKRIAANPRDIEAYERLGDYYFEQLNLEDAQECYRQVAKLSPVHQKARNKIARIERLLGRV